MLIESNPLYIIVVDGRVIAVPSYNSKVKAYYLIDFLFYFFFGNVFQTQPENPTP